MIPLLSSASLLTKIYWKDRPWKKLYSKNITDYIFIDCKAELDNNFQLMLEYGLRNGREMMRWLFN
jgi:hypothetical protein